MPKCILVIDDDEDLLEIFNIIFQEQGYQVVLSNTAKASNYIHHIQPNLIVLDIWIVGSDKTGADICKAFKNDFPQDKIPIILVSAEENIKLLAIDSGADGFISKPFSVDTLVDKVKDLIH